MTGKLLLTFNAGSSTVKIGLFALGPAGAQRIGFAEQVAVGAAEQHFHG